MRNKRLIIALLAAVAFGLIAAISVSRYLANAQAYTKNLTNVVVAKVEIPLGSRIVPEQLSVVQFPKSVAPDGTFAIIDANVVGRVAVTRIAPREPITESRLAAVGVAAGLSSVIPEGYRAMTVKVDDVVGVSGFIQPGTLVDVVVTINPPDDRQRDRISKIVLQNIKVLANGGNIDKPRNEKEVERVKAVTLQVTPEQAEKLALASTEGKLQLVMRNSVDQNDEVTPGANKASLLAGERAQLVPEPGLGSKEEKPRTTTVRRSKPRVVQTSAPANERVTAAPAPPRPSIEVIEGAKKKNVDFP
ncbi:MAG TPA: Flp pilus assembly protein CpaB [Pyrinomonadaceae bacterium]|nr:Flp pilus assembly protein CpaB [Pyrinomonadaceae bacterium]